MASPKIKATYALDVETVRALERTAKRWNVSKSEALRRAIRAVEASSSTGENEAIAALSSLQGRLRLDRAKAESWARTLEAERRRWSRQAESKST